MELIGVVEGWGFPDPDCSIHQPPGFVTRNWTQATLSGEASPSDPAWGGRLSVLLW